MKKRFIKYTLLSISLLIAELIGTPAFGQYKFTYCPLGTSAPMVASEHESYQAIDYQKIYLDLTSELYMNSNGLTNQFVSKFYYGSFLDTPLKTQNWNRLNGQHNLLGYFFNSSLRLNVPAKKNGFSYYAAYENHNMMEVKFHEDFFHLIFFGNRDLAGQSATFDKQSFKTMSYQQFKVGVVKTWFKQSKVQVFSAGLGFNNGQSLMEYSIPSASFFTQENAEYLSLDMNVNMRRSDTVRTKFGAENGAGMCLDLSFYQRNPKSSIEVKVEDLGFIRWNNHSQQYKKDTLVYFEGIEIKDIFDLNSATNTGLTQDSIMNEFAFGDQSAFTEMIPMRASVNYTHYFFNNRLSLSLTLIHYHFLHFNPLIRFVPTYVISIKKSSICIAPNFEYGGYGKFNCGLGISASVKQKFYIELSTAFINSYLDAKKAAGLGGFVSIIKTL